MHKTTMYLLISAVVVLLGHFVFFHGGYFGSDDLEYSHLAYQWLRGQFEHGHNLYAFRYAGFVPLAWSYFIFGINDFANFLVPMLALLGILLLCFKMMPTATLFSKLIVGVLLICNPVHLLYLEKPMPDLLVELGFLLCFYSYYQVRFQYGKTVGGWSLLFIFGAILIFLSKETFLIFYPYWLGCCGMDIFKKTRLRFWAWILVGGILFIALYLLAYKMLLGNPLARVDAIFFERYVSECTYELQPPSVLLRRIGYQLWLDLIQGVFLLPLIFLPLCWSRDAESKFIARSWVALLLLCNFMTISYTQYVPLCNDVRHYMFVLPLGALLVYRGIAQLETFRKVEQWGALLLLLLQLYCSWSYRHENVWFLYLPILVALILHFIGGRKSILYWGFVVGLASVFIQNAHYHLKVNHKQQKELIQFVLAQPESHKRIITDAANARIGNFYAQYDTTKGYFLPFEAFSADTAQAPPYLILNGMTLYLSRQSWEDLPEFAKSAHEKLPKLLENKSGIVYRFN